jgi:uncharacterized protein DUF2017
MSHPFARSKDGVAVSLDEPEAEILRQVVAEIRSVVEAPERPDFARRLFPPAYVDDDEAQAEYADLMTEDLAREKVAAFSAVETSMARGRLKRGRWSVRLSFEESQAWLGVINDARLTLGTKLDVTGEDSVTALDAAAPDAHVRAVYHWLGWLEENLVESLMD